MPLFEIQPQWTEWIIPEDKITRRMELMKDEYTEFDDLRGFAISDLVNDFVKVNGFDVDWKELEDKK